MSRFAVELLDASHDRKTFESGLESVDRYLRETARGHNDKGVSLTRVLVHAGAASPKPVFGYFKLTPCMVEAAGWPDVPKGLPRNPCGAVLLGRLGVAAGMQGAGIGSRLLALARRISHNSLSPPVASAWSSMRQPTILRHFTNAMGSSRSHRIRCG